MNVTSESLTDCKHAAALLKGLNLQREFGQFCDCVIQLQISPGKLFLAHKSVLAVSSPVLASLLASQGALLDLQFPCLSPETMEYLLDFIYMGKLPPKSQEDSVLSVAIDLQMQELQYALIFRRSALSECLNIQNRWNRKRHFTLEEHEEGNTMSLPYPHRPEETLPSCLSCEAVPVIQHASACRKLPQMQQSSTWLYGNNVLSDQPRRQSDSSQIVHLPPRHKFEDYKFQSIDKNHDDFYEPMCKKVKAASHVCPSEHAHQTESPKDSDDELLESGSEALAETSIGISPNTLCVSAQIRPARQKEEDLSSHTEASRTLILRMASSHDGCQSHQYLSEDCEHGNDASDWSRLTEKQHSVPCHSIASANIPVDSSHCSTERHEEPSDHNVLCPLQPEADQPYAVHVSISREEFNQAVESDMQTPRSSLDSKSWFDLGRFKVQGPVVANLSIMADTSTTHESGPDDHSSVASESSSIEQDGDCDLFSPQISSVHTYQGEVRYHCLSGESQQVTGSSDSDEGGLLAASVDAAYSQHSSEAGIALSRASVCEPSVGAFDLGKAQTNSGLNLAVQPYQCTMCDRAFSQRGSLNRHMRSHLGVRPYSCPQCPMTFSRQYRVTEHMRVHQRGCEDQQRSGPT